MTLQAGVFMEKIVEQTLLYDFYGELLTDNQKKIYEFYFLDDLSLGEISEQEGISRQGVYDTIKRCTKLLTNYEDKLHLVEKFTRNKQRVNQIYEHACSVLDNSLHQEYVIEQVKVIQKLSKSIMNEL
jgi:hypothetical protein